MTSAAADGEKPSAHLAQPLLGHSHHPQPYYAYPTAAYAYAPPPPPPTLVLLPSSPVFLRLRRLRPRRIPCIRRFSTRTLPLLLVLALLAGLAFLLYPSAPAARVADIRLARFRINPPPLPALDLNLALSLRVRNPGFLLPLRYRTVSAAVSYRGHLLGSATARPGSGELAARGVTYAYSDVSVDAGRVLDDVIELIGGIAAGSVPLEIVTEVVGAVRLFRFDIPVKNPRKKLLLRRPIVNPVYFRDKTLTSTKTLRSSLRRSSTGRSTTPTTLRTRNVSRSAACRLRHDLGSITLCVNVFRCVMSSLSALRGC